MRCCHCGRRLARAAGMTERGPVGPVCAVKLGLPREIKPQRKRTELPQQRSASVPVLRDPHTLDWIREAATC
jgi:hypothetical protein